jgi:hypothetical protein
VHRGNAVSNYNYSQFYLEDKITQSGTIFDPIDGAHDDLSELEHAHEADNLKQSIVLQTVGNSKESSLRGSGRTRNPPKVLAFKKKQADRNWQEIVPSPMEIRSILKIKTLLDAKTFALGRPKKGTPVILNMEIKKNSKLTVMALWVS